MCLKKSLSAILALFLWAGFHTRAQQIPQIDADRAMAYLTAQTDLGPRNPGSDGHKAGRDYLAAELKKWADEVHLQPFTHKKIEMWNIAATFGEGENPVLLCAHWDTRPFAEHDPKKENRKTPILGANDGASGVAVLLEMARQFHAAPLPYPVVIVLFDGEDYGPTTDEMFLGSTYYAANPIPSKPRFAILLDMVGDADLSIPVEPFSYRAAPELVKGVWKTAHEIGADAFVERMGPAILDDHIPLIKAGIPAIDIIDFSYPHWHTIADTPDKCSAQSLKTVGDVVLRYLFTRVSPP